MVPLVDHLKVKVDSGFSTCVGRYLPELAKLDLEAAKGVQVRSRVRWVEEGESSSAYVFRLEKKCGADCWISAIKLDEGTIVLLLLSCMRLLLLFIHLYSHPCLAT